MLLEQRDGLLPMGGGSVECVHSEGGVAGANQIVNGLLGDLRLEEVMGQCRKMGRQLASVAALDRRADRRLKTPTRARVDLLVDRLANERMGESPAAARF